MMLKRALFPLLITAVLLSACSLPRPAANPTPNVNQVQTQVSQILTNVPETKVAPVQVTSLPAVVPTSTSIPPAATATTQPAAKPTATSLPTATEFVLPTATATAANTATPAPTATTTGPTPTVPASDPKAKLGNPSFKDTFSTDTNWPTGGDKFTSIEIANNAMTLTGLSSLDGWRLTWPKEGDFYLEVTAKTGACKTTDRYGVIFRVPDIKNANAGYLFGFTCDGQYALRKWDGTNMTVLTGWKADTAIQAGPNQTNRLGVLAVGNTISLYANGKLLKEVTDSSYGEGFFGLFIGANQTTNFSITVTEVDLWENPKF